jgi:LCP family protein required for cell wall assembly
MMQNIKNYFLSVKLGQALLWAIALAVVVSVYLCMTSPFVQDIRNGNRINGILIGTDWVDYARHSDTLVFLSYNPKERFLDIISIPRDTHFSPQGYNFTRINEVFAYQYHHSKNEHIASRELCNAVEQLFDNRVKIPYYFQIDYGSFRKFIDLIGGVIVDIEEPMNYDDNAGKLHIHFEPGTYNLNGQKALEYVRYRNSAGDLGRVFRQQRFLKAVIAKWTNPYVIFNTPQVLKMMFKETNSNLSFWDMLNGAIELKDLKLKNVRVSQLPGKPKKLLWEPDYENIAGLLNKIFPDKQIEAGQKSRPRIEVWNAAGTPGLAEKFAWFLRKNGYDVIDYGNFTTRQKKTLIKDLTGDLQSAQRLEEVIGCGEIVTRYDDKRLIDISVILGEDSALTETAKSAQ